MRGGSINHLAGVARLGDGPAREAVASGLLALLCLTVAAIVLQHAAALPARSVPTVLGAFALVLAVLLVKLPRHNPHRRF